jgi:hypothetical protein
VEFSYLPDATTHPVWPAIEALLKPAAEYGDIDVCENGDLVWVAYDGPTVFAAAVTRPLDDEAELRMAAGTRLNDWIHLLDAAVTAWARENGAWRIVMRGRKGWGRFASRFGWAATGKDHKGRTLFQKVL